MRVLVTAIPSAGHVNPLLPLAQSITAAGHEVTLASGSAAAATAATVGVAFLEAGLDEREMVAQAATRLRELPPARRGISMFATIAAPALLDDLLSQINWLAPDLVISEEGEWGGPVLAALAGVPAVTHGWGAPLWSDEDLRAIERATAPLWRAQGLRPRSPAGLFDCLYIDACPPLLQDPRAGGLSRRRTIRFEPFDSGEPPPHWLEAPRTRPLVYATLGTVPTFNAAPDLFAALAEGLGALAVDAILTTGRNNDPETLGPLPSNVHVARHLSQVDVLRRSSVAITHGGAGSTLAALAFGVPLLVLPRGAPSQQRLALQCAALGAALVLQAEETDAASIRDAVRVLLDEPSYRASAERIRDSIDAQPEAAAVVPFLEALAAPARA